MADFAVRPRNAAPPAAVTALAEQVERDGGSPSPSTRSRSATTGRSSVCYPMSKVDATPYQRDLSPTHVKRLTEVVKKIDRFVDPIVVMAPEPGVYWTPNGNHRRTRSASSRAR